MIYLWISGWVLSNAKTIFSWDIFSILHLQGINPLLLYNSVFKHRLPLIAPLGFLMSNPSVLYYWIHVPSITPNSWQPTEAPWTVLVSSSHISKGALCSTWSFSGCYLLPVFWVILYDTVRFSCSCSCLLKEFFFN